MHVYRAGERPSRLSSTCESEHRSPSRRALISVMPCDVFVARSVRFLDNFSAGKLIFHAIRLISNIPFAIHLALKMSLFLSKLERLFMNRYARCNICRVLLTCGLRGHFHAPAAQLTTIQSTLFSLH